MPFRKLATAELAKLLGVLSNQCRITILQELREGELRVSEIQERTGMRPPTVSQHLSLLKAHQLISERRDGRNVYYTLKNPDLSLWIAGGLDFIIPESKESRRKRTAIRATQDLWLSEE